MLLRTKGWMWFRRSALRVGALIVCVGLKRKKLRKVGNNTKPVQKLLVRFTDCISVDPRHMFFEITALREYGSPHATTSWKNEKFTSIGKIPSRVFLYNVYMLSSSFFCPSCVIEKVFGVFVVSSIGRFSRFDSLGWERGARGEGFLCIVAASDIVFGPNDTLID